MLGDPRSTFFIGGSLEICLVVQAVFWELDSSFIRLSVQYYFSNLDNMDVIDVGVDNLVLPILSLPDIAVLRVQGLRDALTQRRVPFGRDVLKAALVILLQDHENERRRLAAGIEGQDGELAGGVLGGDNDAARLAVAEVEVQRVANEAVAVPGAQNMNVDRLNRISKKVEIYVNIILEVNPFQIFAAYMKYLHIFL